MFISDACLNKDTLVPLMHATADLIKANEREHIIIIILKRKFSILFKMYAMAYAMA